MNPRFCAVDAAAMRHNEFPVPLDSGHTSSTHFGSNVFNRFVMKRMLPPEIYKNIMNAMEGKEKIREEFADPIAIAMKEWAVSHGATHYTHWFHPLTGAAAEKHDAFIDWSSPDQMVEKFTGKQLIQGEPDASSFPSGGLRSTFEARGYTGWDPTSPVFVWKAGGSITLCIPSVFFSWTGDVLDNKIPLLRSERKMSESVGRLLKLTGINASYVKSTIGLEQEYFVIDRALANLRPDILLAGKTVFGAPSPKAQELQDHYFGVVKERILSFMNDFELGAVKLGIPIKTRHNEVAPAQHEMAPSVERASVAIDHNILLMELMRKVGMNHDLKVLLHEKPFADINGSGKHCNWSLATDTGINLLHPTETPGNNLHFMVLLTAILKAVHRHAELFRASIGSASNDCRLGGHEAPPAIISVYLGHELEELLIGIEKKGVPPEALKRGKYDFGLLEIPELDKDNTDRNRTSPFAFTGNKFEFRALGSSSNPAFTVAMLNSVVAESLDEIVGEIEKKIGAKRPTKEKLLESVFSVLKPHLKESRPVRFSGDNYSAEWLEEAEKRGLPNIEKSIDAFTAFISPSTVKAFKGILTKEELQSRYEITAEHYALTLDIEAKLMSDLFKTQILPSAISYQTKLAKSITAYKEAMGSDSGMKNQKEKLALLTRHIENAISRADELEQLRQAAEKLPMIKRAKAISQKVLSKGKELRKEVDALESLVDDQLWQMPKYRELLFMI